MKRSVFWLLLCCLMAVTLVLWSCGGTPGGEQEEEEQEEEEEEEEESESSPFLDMLRFIPDTSDTRLQLFICDYARIKQIYDISPPLSDADDEAMEEYILELALDESTNLRFSSPSFISGMGPLRYAPSSPIRRQNIGFGPLDVDVDISAGTEPHAWEVIKGSFDLSVIEDAMNQYDESVTPEVGSYKGIVTYDWGPGSWSGHRLSPPAFNNFSQGGTIAVQNDYILRASDMDNMKLMINASQGGGTSLADNPDFSLMATALSEMGAYSCRLTDQALWEHGVGRLSITYDDITEEAATAAVGQFLNPYRTYACGIGEDAEGPSITIVLVYDNPHQASSDVDALEQQIESGVSLSTDKPWRDIIDSFDIWAEGCSLRAKLRGDIVSEWNTICWASDTLLLMVGE